MKTTHVLATLIAATLPLTAVLAEDTAKPAVGDQTKEERSQGMGMMDENKSMMMGMKMEQMMSMMSNWKDQDAELGKLVAEMNSAPADKKLDAVAAALTKLVEQRKALHEQMQKMMGSNETDMMKMCGMMMRMMKAMKMEGDQGARKTRDIVSITNLSPGARATSKIEPTSSGSARCLRSSGSTRAAVTIRVIELSEKIKKGQFNL
jgi:hypothetical protein